MPDEISTTVPTSRHSGTASGGATSFAGSGAGSAYIEPGSPWQNPYVESFGSRVRDELLGVEVFSCLAEAQVLIEDWRQDYNHHRPHSSLARHDDPSRVRRQPPPTAARADSNGGWGRGRSRRPSEQRHAANHPPDHPNRATAESC
jgi:Integrase core domain